VKLVHLVGFITKKFSSMCSVELGMFKNITTTSFRNTSKQVTLIEINRHDVQYLTGQ